MKKVLVLDRLHEDGISLLRARDDVHLTHLPDPTPETMRDGMAKAEALLLRARVLEPALYESAPNLRLISRHGVGCDNLPLPLLAEKGISVAITAAANAVTVAEHTLMLMLALARDLVAADAAVRDGNFAVRENMRAVDLSGRTLFIVGLGRIGREVASRAAAFGMRTLGYDPLLPASADLSGIERVGKLEQGLAQADIVTLHVPSTDSTRGMFDMERLEQMKEGAFLINTARGSIVDEQALCAALRSGRLAAAGIDVFEKEPLPADDAVLSAPNLIVTPHAAGMTADSVRRMAMHAAQAILDFLDGHHDRVTLYQ